VIVPVWVRCALAAVLVASMAWAFWGRPPRRSPRPRTWRHLAGLGLGLYSAGCATLVLGHAVVSAALIGTGVEMLSLVAWLGRALGADEDDGPPAPDDGGEPGGGGDDGPPGWDDRDEQAFRDYVAQRERRRPRDPAPL
jgi:hypothetical protein